MATASKEKTETQAAEDVVSEGTTVIESAKNMIPSGQKQVAKNAGPKEHKLPNGTTRVDL